MVAPVLGKRPQAEIGLLIYLVNGKTEDLDNKKSLREITSTAIHYKGT